MEKIRLKFKSYDYRLLDQTVKKIVEELKETGGKVSGPIPLPTKRTLYTVLRSTNINKTSREQFEMRIHKRLIEVKFPTKDTGKVISNFDLPAGIEVEIKQVA